MSFVVMALAFFAACAVYLSALVVHRGAVPTGYLDGGAYLPGRAAIFAGSGPAVAGQGLANQLALTARFGLQANHQGLGFVLAALTAVLVQKRLWLAGL